MSRINPTNVAGYTLATDFKFDTPTTNWEEVSKGVLPFYAKPLSRDNETGANISFTNISSNFSRVGAGAGGGSYGSPTPSYFNNSLLVFSRGSALAQPTVKGDASRRVAEQPTLISRDSSIPAETESPLLKSSGGSMQTDPSVKYSITPSIFQNSSLLSDVLSTTPRASGIDFSRNPGYGSLGARSFMLATGDFRFLFSNQAKFRVSADVPRSGNSFEVSRLVSTSLSAIRNRFGSFLPVGARNGSTANAEKAAKIVGDAEFSTVLKKNRPDIEVGSERAKRVNGLYGSDGIVYVNADAARRNSMPISTVYTHEALHHYANVAYDRFIETDPVAQQYGHAMREGVTEYFTQQIVGNQHPVYKNETQVVEDLVNTLGEATLRRAYFQGDQSALSKIKSYLDNASAQ
jgi:hypothetical protein